MPDFTVYILYMQTSLKIKVVPYHDKKCCCSKRFIDRLKKFAQKKNSSFHKNSSFKNNLSIFFQINILSNDKFFLSDDYKSG